MRSHTDQQVREWKTNAFTLALTINLSSTKSDRDGDWMNRQSREQFLDELLPTRSSLRIIGAGRTVRQFD